MIEIDLKRSYTRTLHSFCARADFMGYAAAPAAGYPHFSEVRRQRWPCWREDVRVPRLCKLPEKASVPEKSQQERPTQPVILLFLKALPHTDRKAIFSLTWTSHRFIFMPYGNAVWTKIEHIRICPVQEPVEDYACAGGGVMCVMSGSLWWQDGSCVHNSSFLYKQKRVRPFNRVKSERSGKMAVCARYVHLKLKSNKK